MRMLIGRRNRYLFNLNTRHFFQTISKTQCGTNDCFTIAAWLCLPYFVCDCDCKLIKNRRFAKELQRVGGHKAIALLPGIGRCKAWIMDNSCNLELYWFVIGT